MRRRLDELPLPLRALAAYVALAGTALMVFGAVKLDDGWLDGLIGSVMLLAAGTMTIPQRSAWWSLVAGLTTGLILALVFNSSATVGSTVALVVLALPSSRVFFGFDRDWVRDF